MRGIEAELDTSAGGTRLPMAARCLLVVLTLLAGAALAPARAHAAGDAEAQCRALRHVDFSTVQDAPLLVTDTAISSEGAAAPYCRVRGYVVPEVTFELRLPTSGWNHGLVLAGTGGWASRKRTVRCHEALGRNYACIAGDGGHQTDGGLWMQANAQAKIDWGYRATHVTALAGKAIARAFYGDAPKTSLMLGCSTSGYQGLVEAQRFPWDFDGIIAVAPDIDEGDLSMRTAWAAHNLVGGDGRPVFAKPDLQVLHQAALKACDRLDGVQDGIIGDPLACRFDPRTVLCRNATSTSCLSQRQVDAALRIYGGPTTSNGVRISTAGPFPGSELEWPDILEDVSFAENYFRFALADFPRDGFPASKLDYDEDYKRLGLGGTFIDSNPDLRRFKDASGKLLIIQGGNDVTEQAHAALDYYDMVERVMGGKQATQAFARLFLVPGMNHCFGGDGAFAIDYLSTMEKWVTTGRPPNMLIGSHVAASEPGYDTIEEDLTAPAPGMTTTFTRPVYPYPLHAHYNGRGDVNDAASFHPEGPK